MKRALLILIFIFLFQVNIVLADSADSNEVGGNFAYTYTVQGAYLLPETEVIDSNLKSRCEIILQKTYLLEKRDSELKKNNNRPAERLSVLSKLTAYYDSLLIFGCVYEPED